MFAPSDDDNVIRRENRPTSDPHLRFAVGARVPSGEVYGGSPAAFIRKLSKEEITEFQMTAESTQVLAAKHADEFLPYGEMYQLKEEMVAAKK